MNFGLLLSMYVIGLAHAARLPQRTQEAAARVEEHGEPAWYHLPVHSQPPLVSLPTATDRSPFGPRVSGIGTGDSFVPIPSPFGLPRPKTSQEIAASQIVNAAQGRHRREFVTEAEDDENDEFSERVDELVDHDFGQRPERPVSPTENGGQRRRGTTTESPLRRILSREITNIERYMPLLARKLGGQPSEELRIPKAGSGMRSHRTTPVVFPPAVRLTTKRPFGVRRRLITTTPTTAPPFRRRLPTTTAVPEVVEVTKKCLDCDRESPPTPRTNTSTSRGCRGKTTTRRPRRPHPDGRRTRPPTLPPAPLPLATTSAPTPPPFTGVPRRTFNKWTKFTLRPRRLLPTDRKATERGIATQRPLVFPTDFFTPGPPNSSTSTEATVETTTQSAVSSLLSRIFTSRCSQPWTHRETKSEAVVCPDGNVSPVEAAVVWFVDQLRSKTNASTELIEAVKEALARFRSTLTNPAVPPAAAPAGLNGELESTWKNIMDGGWLERAFAEWAFADAGRPLAADPSAPDSQAAARKVDELWREAMVASSLSTAQHSETGGAEGRSKAFRPFRTEAGRFHRVPLRDQPIGERKEASGIPINCQLLCSILKTIQGDSPQTRPN
ncbi:hypothetical protein M3Y99_01431200 [Aphelenchoides fujianensis]|nr:hypothetical protein M3Y99_01431200 [Aphelenchoides fujianensis]